MVNQRKYGVEIFFLSVCSLVLILDQITKYLILTYKPQIDLNLLIIHFVRNTGAGFGVLKDHVYLLALVSLVVVLAVILLYRKIPRKTVPQLFFALFLGGVVGNLIDRLFRKFVIDFIDFGFWPAFNLADAAISVAVVGLVVYFWRK